MVSARKRSLHELNGGAPEPPSLLHRLRNMWEFANLCQWIYIFGKAVKIDDDLDIEEIETECLKPHSTVLVDIGLALLRCVSSHRGLTHDLFDEYTRRQYQAKNPEKNPFGDEETPAKFLELDIFTKIRILQQLTQWVMIHPERIRDKMEEQRDMDQASWRIEPLGWDSDDRTYFVLDDNRIYRMIEPPQPVPTKRPLKKKPKPYRAGTRASNRRRISGDSGEQKPIPDEEDAAENQDSWDTGSDGLGGRRWECIAVTLEEVRAFLQTIQKTRDENEKVLRSRLQDHLVPILEKQEESRKRKALQREKELLNLAKLANAKRSSRIANKVEQQKLEEKTREEEQKRLAEEAAARREEQQRLKLEKERDLRMMSREQRLKERQARRVQHEEELAQLSEDTKSQGSGTGRFSERQLQAEIERNKQALKELEEEEEDWIFDCVCGAYGQVDDGSHSIACEKCNVWQHSKCVGVAEEEAERDEFHFVCGSCRRKEEAARAPKPPRIKLKVNRPPDSPRQAASTTVRASQPAGHTEPIVKIPRAKHDPTSSVVHTTAAPQGDTNQLASVQQAEPKLPAQSPAPPASNGLSAMPRQTQYIAAPVPSTSSYPSSSPASVAQKALSPSVVFPPVQHHFIGSPAHVIQGGYKPDLQPQGEVRGSNGYQMANRPLDIGSVSPSVDETTRGQPPTTSQPSNGTWSGHVGGSSPPLPRINGFSTAYTPAPTRVKVASQPPYGLSAAGAAPVSPPVPSFAGISPMKQSPPLAMPQLSRPNFDTVTPILPPVATLMPSPPNHNPTPPIKHSELVPARTTEAPSGQS